MASSEDEGKVRSGSVVSRGHSINFAAAAALQLKGAKFKTHLPHHYSSAKVLICSDPRH